MSREEFEERAKDVEKLTLRSPTLGDAGHHQIEAACRALGRLDLTSSAVDAFDVLSNPWKDWLTEDTPYWSSDITDDGSPFELSIAFADGKPELRILAETQQQPLTAVSNWNSSLALHARLRARFGADFSRFDRIAGLFAPLPSIPVRFSMWHAAALGAHDEAPRFKVYLNPQVVGLEGASRLVERALSELGIDSAWRTLAQSQSAAAQYMYFSLDLVAGASARVKVYTSHPGATADEIAAQVVAASRTQERHARASIADVITKLSGSRGPLQGRAVQTCYAFREEGAAPEVTTYVPVRSYVADDAEAVARAAELLHEPDEALLRRTVSMLADRALTSGRGLVTYVGVRDPAKDGECRRITTYLSPQVYAIASPRRPVSRREAPPRSTGLRMLRPLLPPAEDDATLPLSFADIQALLDTRQAALASHPFLMRLSEAGTHAEVLRIAPRVAFFVMCFQDVLRLVHEQTKDPALKALAHVHAQEDRGHDLWYLRDLARLGVEIDVKDLFSDETRSVRDIGYRLVSDAVSARDDRARLGVVLALEAAGKVFFGRMVTCLERLDVADGLTYFARHHQQVEADHELLATGPDSALSALVVPSAVVPEFRKIIERTFAAMRALADDLADCARALCTPKAELA